MPINWGLEYLRGNIPESRLSYPEQSPPEEPAVGVTDTRAVFTRGGVNVPDNDQEVNTSEIQQSEVLKNPAKENQLKNQVNQAIGPKQLLESIVAYLRKYLVCDDHQYTVLALWIVHTWIFRKFRSVAYLDIRSPESQSGKTLCLQLLQPLCNDPLIAAGLEPATMVMSMLIKDKIMDRERARSTLLFDDCQHTFAPSERQRILAMLNSGSRIPCLNMDRIKVYDAFNPKAFATSGRLPRSLAARCIPILLRRKKPSEVVTRFNGQQAKANLSLKESLETWVNANEDLFEDASNHLPALPPAFTARQLDCAEPLVYIADLAGGPWPQRARTALVALFEVADCSEGLQMLSDIRSMFHLRNNPEHILTRDLLAELITHENRPWAAWHGKSGKKLGRLLSPFGISSQTLWEGEDSFKGYKLEDFQDTWERYLPPLSVTPQQSQPTATKETT